MVKVNNNINILTKAILDAQEKYQKVLSKALFVISTHNSYLGYDGYVDKTGNFFVFKLVNLLTGIQDVLSGIAQRIETNFLPYLKINIDNPKDIFSSDQDSLIYLLLYGAFRDKNGLENFEKQILLKSINPDKNFTSNNEKISKIFKSYWGEKLIRYNNKYKEETVTFLTNLTKYTNDIVISLKAIKPNGTAGYISLYEVIESPDNDTKTAILTLNGVDNYDSNKTTWNKNSNGFILVKNLSN